MTDKFIKDKINLEKSDVYSFWESHYNNCNDIMSGNLQKDSTLARLRSENEYNTVFSKYINKDSVVLDIGCGVGRVAEFCKNVKSYYGLDLSSNAISYARSNFKSSSVVTFDVCQIDSELDQTLKEKDQKYNFIIFGGFFAYINDEKLVKIINTAKKYLLNNGFIYIREPVSIEDTRLTLKNHYSEELNREYHAIYRTVEEYNSVYTSIFDGKVRLLKSDFLLKDDNRNRKETSQYYWIFKNNEQ